ncbi:MAG: hypothetical protein ACRDVC_09255 [Acidimicrobiales bacterium]
MSDASCRRAGTDDLRDLAALRFEWRAERGEHGLDAREFESRLLEGMDEHRSTHRGARGRGGGLRLALHR